MILYVFSFFHFILIASSLYSILLVHEIQARGTKFRHTVILSVVREQTAQMRTVATKFLSASRRRAVGINNLVRDSFFSSQKAARVRSRPCATASQGKMWRAFVSIATAEGHRGDALAVSRAAANGGRLICPRIEFAVGGIPQFLSAATSAKK